MQEDTIKRELIYRGGIHLTNMGSSNADNKPNGLFSDFAVAMLSRDYKGLGNEPGNGVIEIWKLNE